MKSYTVTSKNRGTIVVKAISRRHAIAKTLVHWIKDGVIKLLDFDTAEVARWKVTEGGEV